MEATIRQGSRTEMQLMDTNNLWGFIWKKSINRVNFVENS